MNQENEVIQPENEPTLIVGEVIEEPEPAPVEPDPVLVEPDPVDDVPVIQDPAQALEGHLRGIIGLPIESITYAGKVVIKLETCDISVGELAEKASLVKRMYRRNGLIRAVQVS